MKKKVLNIKVSLVIGCFMENGDHCTSLQNNNQPIQAFFVFGALSALPLLNLQS